MNAIEVDEEVKAAAAPLILGVIAGIMDSDYDTAYSCHVRREYENDNIVMFTGYVTPDRPIDLLEMRRLCEAVERFGGNDDLVFNVEGREFHIGDDDDLVV